MEVSYKFRIYPNKEQEQLIQKTFGCVRYVYNYFLAQRIEAYNKYGKTLSFYEQCKDLTELKQKYEWLCEPDKCALQNALRNLDAASMTCGLYVEIQKGRMTRRHIMTLQSKFREDATCRRRGEHGSLYQGHGGARALRVLPIPL